MKIRNFNVNKIVNISQRHLILTLFILAFPIWFISDFNSTNDGINSEERLLLIILCNLFYSTNNLMANLSVINALLIASSERFSIAWNPVFVFRYRCFDGQFPGFGEYIFPPTLELHCFGSVWWLYWRVLLTWFNNFRQLFSF